MRTEVGNIKNKMENGKRGSGVVLAKERRMVEKLLDREEVKWKCWSTQRRVFDGSLTERPGGRLCSWITMERSTRCMVPRSHGPRNRGAKDDS